MVKQNINVVEESEKLKITADDMRDFLKSKRKTLSTGKKKSVRLDKIVANNNSVIISKFLIHQYHREIILFLYHLQKRFAK